MIETSDVCEQIDKNHLLILLHNSQAEVETLLNRVSDLVDEKYAWMTKARQLEDRLTELEAHQ